MALRLAGESMTALSANGWHTADVYPRNPMASPYATYRQLSEVTGLRQDQLRGAVRTARKSKGWTKELNERELPNTSPGSSKIEFRVQAIWKFLPRVRARAQK